MRPPALSIWLFIGAFAFLAWGAVSTRMTPRETRIAETHVETAAANAGAAPPPITAPDFSWSYNALDPGVSVEKAAPSLFDPSDDYWGLPRDGAYDLVAGYCSACHSLKLVMQQHATKSRWEELLQWMIDEQGMAAPADDERGEMIDYLSNHFGP